MRILSISAQKPNSTGSGVYLTELVKAFAENGHAQAVIAGICGTDVVSLPENVEFYPVLFETDELPFPVAGMSDEMPYLSTRYCDMTEEMADRFTAAFVKKTREAIERFQPDLILAHHLYLMTAAVRAAFPEQKIYGFCHNTDLRQMWKTDLRREFIAAQIKKLDHIFALQEMQKENIKKTYGISDEQITIIGTGFNASIFRDMGMRKKDGTARIVYAGKIAEKKGVKSLIKSLALLPPDAQKRTEVHLAGGAGNEREYREILALSETCPVKTVFCGKLTQAELAELYGKCGIFVLPSFYEGMPLTVIEALACGCRVVLTDLPGVQEWLSANIADADIRYVPMPKMKNTDEPVESSLGAFEAALADALTKSIEQKKTKPADVSGISWRAVAEKVLAV